MKLIFEEILNFQGERIFSQLKSHPFLDFRFYLLTQSFHKKKTTKQKPFSLDFLIYKQCPYSSRGVVSSAQRYLAISPFRSLESSYTRSNAWVTWLREYERNSILEHVRILWVRINADFHRANTMLLKGSVFVRGRDVVKLLEEAYGRFCVM